MCIRDRSYIYILMLCIYLATKPSKRQSMFFIGQYLVCGALQMIYGSRSDFILGLMFIVVYFVMRDRLNDDTAEAIREVWYGKKEMVFTIVAIPLLIVLLVFIGYYRRNNSFHFTGLIDTLFEFFESQGTTIDVIGYTKIYEDTFTQPKFLYLFDRTYEFLTTNPIGSILTGRQAYASNTIERAKYGTSLGMTLYYQINSISYLAGYGCGSSYIAEAWLGYGYFGLFIINFALSRIISRLNEYKFNKFIPSVVCLIFLQSLFFIPRNNFDYFVDDMASMTNIFAIIILWMLYKLFQNRQGISEGGVINK